MQEYFFICFDILIFTTTKISLLIVRIIHIFLIHVLMCTQSLVYVFSLSIDPQTRACRTCILLVPEKRYSLLDACMALF